jgi:hypothetical protein
MELRNQKAAFALLAGLLSLTPALFAQQEFRYDVRHGRFGTRRVGTLVVSEKGISFRETTAKPKKNVRDWQWDYGEIQQLKIAPKSLTVLTYKDNKWKLGTDRGYQFDLLDENTFEKVYNLLKNRLDQRLVAAIPDRPAALLWQVPAKHLLRFGGSEGVLEFGPDVIVYDSSMKNESRTWRYQDIENISTSGPFQLTVTTFERAKAHYGSFKGFNFQLKERLDEDRYNDIWLLLNQSKGLKVLNSYSRGAGAQ